MTLEIIELAGTPEEMARQHAEACYDSARAMIRARCDLALKRGRELDPDLTMERCLTLAAEHLPVQAAYAPEVTPGSWRSPGRRRGRRRAAHRQRLSGSYIDVLLGRLAGGGCTVHRHRALLRQPHHVSQTGTCTPSPSHARLPSPPTNTPSGLRSPPAALSPSGCAPARSRSATPSAPPTLAGAPPGDDPRACARPTYRPRRHRLGRASGHYYYVAWSAARRRASRPCDQTRRAACPAANRLRTTTTTRS